MTDPAERLLNAIHASDGAYTMDYFRHLLDEALAQARAAGREEAVTLDGIGVQVFEPDISETEPGQWRFVRFEPCPLGRNRRHCKSEHHHWGRGDHVVPVHPDWVIGEAETAILDAPAEEES